VVGVGGFDDQLFHVPGYEDGDLWLRLRELADFYYLDMCLAFYTYNPQHSITHLTNLPLFARKYWSHPTLQSETNSQLREDFVRRCAQDMTGRMRLLLSSNGGIVTTEMLTRLYSLHQTFHEVFGDTYTRVTKYSPIDLPPDHLDSTLVLLLYLYLSRFDLQTAFPETSSGDYARLVAWAYDVARGVNEDIDRISLTPHTRKLS